MNSVYTKESFALRVAFYVNILLLAVVAAFANYNSAFFFHRSTLTLFVSCLLIWPYAIHLMYVCVLSFPFNTFPSERCIYPFKVKVSSGGKAKVGGIVSLLSIISVVLLPFIVWLGLTLGHS